MITDKNYKIRSSKLEKQREERKKLITIVFEEMGERFEIEQRIAIPIIEALRTRKRIKESPENMDIDIMNTAKLLRTFSELDMV